MTRRNCDGKTRGAFWQSPGVFSYTDQLGEKFHYRGGSREDGQFRAWPHMDDWFTSAITSGMFDEAFASRPVGLGRRREVKVKGPGRQRRVRLAAEGQELTFGALQKSGPDMKEFPFTA